MRICGCKAHCSLQCRPTHTLPCSGQHYTITKFRFKKNSVHHVCNQLDWHALSPTVFNFHSLAATVPLVQPLSLQAASNAELWMQGSLLASMQTCTHPAMPSAIFHSHNILIGSKNGSLHVKAQLQVLTWTNPLCSHHHWRQVGPLSLPKISSADMWMQGSSLDSTQACIHPAMPDAAWHRHKIFMLPRLITSASRTGSKTFLSARCFVQILFEERGCPYCPVWCCRSQDDQTPADGIRHSSSFATAESRLPVCRPASSLALAPWHWHCRHIPDWRVEPRCVHFFLAHSVIIRPHRSDTWIDTSRPMDKMLAPWLKLARAVEDLSRSVAQAWGSTRQISIAWQLPNSSPLNTMALKMGLTCWACRSCGASAATCWYNMGLLTQIWRG